MKLYFHPMTRAVRARWTLEELGIPYDLQRMDIDGDDCEKPEYRKVHPLGLLPALEDDGLTLFESAAICLHLADRHPEKKLIPALGTPERALVYQWTLFTVTELETPILEVYLQTVALAEEKRVASNLAWGKETYASRAAVVEQALEGKEFIVGNALTVADIMLASLLAWAGFMGLTEGYPNIQAYVKRCGKRPANKKARE